MSFTEDALEAVRQVDRFRPHKDVSVCTRTHPVPRRGHERERPDAGHADARSLLTLLVEQNAEMALSIANRGYVMVAGEIVLQGLAWDLKSDESVKKAILAQRSRVCRRA